MLRSRMRLFDPVEARILDERPERGLESSQPGGQEQSRIPALENLRCQVCNDVTEQIAGVLLSSALPRGAAAQADRRNFE